MRHDDYYLRKVKEHIGYQVFSELQQLPFLFIKGDVGEGEASSKEQLLETMELAPFDRLTCIHEDHEALRSIWIDRENLKISSIAYSDSYGYMGRGKLGAIACTIDVNKTESSEFYFTSKVTYFKNKKETDVKDLKIPNLYRSGSTKFKGFSEEGLKDNYKYMKEDLNDMLYFLYNLHSNLKEAQHKHLVKVVREPTKKVKGKKTTTSNSSKYGATHHYVYLDAPSYETKDSESTGTGKSPRGHHRRAYFKVLRHPKFKNHPHYQQKIRVKSCWVGPKEWVDNGKIYTLIGD